jgi:hypothetical protein
MQEPAHQAPVNPDRSVKLPEFCGEVDIDKMSVMEYISAVEMSRIAGNWSDAITAERVKLRLSGPARTWLNNRIRAETAGLNVFDPAAVARAKPPGLRQLLIDRFMPQHTAAEQERLRATLIRLAVSNVAEDLILGVEDSNLTAAVETATSEEQEHTEAGAAMPTLQWSKLALIQAHTNPTSNKDL